MCNEEPESFKPDELKSQDMIWFEIVRNRHLSRAGTGWLHNWNVFDRDALLMSDDERRFARYGHHAGYMAGLKDMQRDVDRVEEDLMNHRLSSADITADSLRLSWENTRLKHENERLAKDNERLLYFYRDQCSTTGWLISDLIDRQARGDYYHAILMSSKAHYYEWGGQGDREGFVHVPPSMFEAWTLIGKQNVEKLWGTSIPPHERTYTPAPKRDVK